MTKTDNLLNELDSDIPEYIKKIGDFQVNNIKEQCHIIRHYTAKNYRTCMACGKPNIIQIFVVQDTQGNQFEIGSHCIINASNERILAQFKNYEQKRQNITKNRNAIDILNGFIPAIEDDTSPIFVSNQGTQRLKQMYERMCNGNNPLDSQWKLFYYYIKKL